MKSTFSFPLVLLAVLFGAATVCAEVIPQRLTCEYQTNPLGVDTPRPRLAWQLTSKTPGQKQTAYRILAATQEKLLAPGKADLWDSDWQTSEESIHIEYDGAPLQSGKRVYWTVLVRDRNGIASKPAPTAWWEMGLLNETDWHGRWIALDRPLPEKDEDFYGDHPAPLFRKNFSLDRPIKQARLYITGLGYYDLRCNGQRPDDRMLDPGWTTYSKRVLYSTYDVTRFLKQGGNGLAVELGNGWYNPLPMRMWGRFNLREALPIGQPRFLAQLNVTFEDGTKTSIKTDSSWQSTEGPRLRNSVYLGETYDARREIDGWTLPGFDDATWKPAITLDAPGGKLRSQMAPPIRPREVLEPVAITEPKPGVFVADFGKNFTGVVELSVKGPAGTRVSMTSGELVYPDGTVNPMTAACGQIKAAGAGGPGAPDVAVQKDVYILKGTGQEVWRPRFTFHGFRYVQLKGFPGRPDKKNLRGIALSTALRPVGRFRCSNPMFNQVHEVFANTLLSNVLSVQSDCPAREKFGYGGDIVACGEAVLWNFDVATFYQKVVRDFEDAARENGAFTETAPFVGIGIEGLGPGAGPVGWGTAHPMVQYHCLNHYGNRRLVEQQWKSTCRWIALLESKAENDILVNGIGDHESLVPKSIGVSGTAFYYYNVWLAGQMADMLGKNEEARYFSQKAEQIRKRFNEHFLNSQTGQYDTGTQANQSFAFYMGLVPAESRAKSLAFLLDDLQKNDHHLTTGIFGTKYLLQILSDQGRPDIAYTIANQKTCPGWGYMLENGATTLWENWKGSDNTFSNDHPMFGSICSWFVRCLGGIAPARDAIGFDRVVIEPKFVAGLEWATAEYDSIRGLVRTDWKRHDGRIILTVTIPVGTCARIVLPAKSAEGILIDRAPLEKAKNVDLIETENGKTACRIGSGTHQFQFDLPKSK